MTASVDFVSAVGCQVVFGLATLLATAEVNQAKVTCDFYGAVGEWAG